MRKLEKYHHTTFGETTSIGTAFTDHNPIAFTYPGSIYFPSGGILIATLGAKYYPSNPERNIYRSYKLITNFLKHEKHNYSNKESKAFNTAVNQIVNMFTSYRIGIELTPGRGILFTLVHDNFKIHIETFLGKKESFQIYYFSIFKDRKYKFNGSGTLHEVIAQIKQDLNLISPEQISINFRISDNPIMNSGEGYLQDSILLQGTNTEPEIKVDAIPC